MLQHRSVGFLPWVLLLSGVPAVAGHTTTGSRVLAVGPEACAVSPLLMPATAAFCQVEPEMDGSRPGSLEPGTAAPASANDTQRQEQQQSVDMSWQGPHFCVGDMCVYSNPSFSQGQGVVVVGTARGAEAIANALDAAAAKTPEESAAGTTPPFEQKEIPGKGLGLVAARSIRRGEPIMARPPVVLVQQNVIDMDEQEETEVAQLQLYDAAIARLPQETVEKFLSQAAQQSASKDRARRVKDIMETNSFNMAVGGMSHVANFLDVSRLNHDCRPNLVFHISRSLSHMTFAVRDIAAGEELTISYLDPFRARVVRQARAERNWGFACTCPQCSLAPPLAAESDGRLLSIYQLESRLRDWPLAPTATQQREGEQPLEPASGEALLSLYAEERLDCALGDAYTLAALNYNAFGRAELAVKYALLAVEAGSIEHGEQGHDVQDMKKLLGGPEKHWSWRRRVLG